MTEAYAELHAHSGFSFLDGSSDPEELVAEADRLGLQALALTDHHGFYGVVRFAEAARLCGLPTVFGTEVTLVAGLYRERAGEPGLVVQDPSPQRSNGNARHGLAAQCRHPRRALLRAEVPLGRQRVLRCHVIEHLDQARSWSNPAEYVAELQRRNLGPNFAAFIGHSDMRASVMGLDRATRKEVRPSPSEVAPNSSSK